MKNNNNNNNQKKDLERLINISKSIYKIYCEKISTNCDNNKLNQYLDLALEVENEIYYNLNINAENYDTTITESLRLLNKYYNQELITEDEKTAIQNRIENHCTNLAFGNPFLSTKKNYNEKLEEEHIIIKNQAENEYYNNLLYFLSEKANNTKIKEEQKRCSEVYNMALFEHKNLENIKKLELKNNSRQKCILFNHDENTINYVYENYLFSIIKDFISICIFFTDLDLENYRYRVEQNITIQFLKSALCLLTKNEMGKLMLNFKNKFLENEEYDEIRTISSKSVSKIIDTIKETALEKGNDYKKQKI